MTSWKTTLFGLLAGIGGGITGAYLLKPDLLASFPHWLPGLGVLMTSIGTACLGLAARDNDKTSEQVGAAPAPASSPARSVTSLLMLGFFLGSISCAGVMLPGCGTTPQQTAYATAGTTITTVDAAMTAWGDYVAQFHPPASQETAVKAAYQKYQAAMQALVDAMQIYVTLSGSTNSPPALNTVAAAEQLASQSCADLVALLKQFGVNL